MMPAKFTVCYILSRVGVVGGLPCYILNLKQLRHVKSNFVSNLTLIVFNGPGPIRMQKILTQRVRAGEVLDIYTCQ